MTRFLTLLLFAFSTGLAIRLAWAEARSRAELTGPRASTAGNARTLQRLAEADPAHRQDWLRAAVTANPRFSSVWITLGLDAERSGDFSAAEDALLEAARVDRQFLPAWTLTNYYFRRGDGKGFWPWAHRAAFLTFDDYRPLLRLADRLAPDPRAVIVRLGGGAPLTRAYLDLLIGENRLDDAQPMARLLLARRDPADRARLAAFAGLQLRSGNRQAALELNDSLP